MNIERRAKIIATIGPASQSPALMRALLQSGMDVARFNFSHGGPLVHAAHIQTLRDVARDLESPLAILQDLQGPKIRTGGLTAGAVELIAGNSFTITTRPVGGDEHEVSTTYQALPRDCRRGDSILLDDGNLSLRVESTNETDVQCVVVDGGILKTNKGINLPGVDVSAPALSSKDKHDVEWAISQKLDYVALSFVRRVEDVLELRKIVEGSMSSIKIISKLEKPEAIDNLDEIIAVSDGVMVARGDLGVEMQTEDVPLLQKQIIKRANEMGKIVITATQMLESMTTNPRPTRAEASDVANAILDGTDAVMLSGETANGAHPIEAVKVMSRIVAKMENSTEDGLGGPHHFTYEKDDFASAICQAAAYAAGHMGAKAIACFTEYGGTARKLAKFRPPAPVIAFTPHDFVVRQLNLAWGVRGQVISPSQSTDEMIEKADVEMLKSGLVVKGDKIVVVLGAPVALCGSTNLMKLHRIGENDVR
ncbi:pyruvate kinase [Abditibacterium utsteinense]|uniref:Pyruvate kinase n=1 Tax=Abditibacterium utsteinense TaxID=1960156 RepID=A0A2S8SW01_9BACT|nr:pyruvate kinase [Abditibacterium utsteinense]PQV64959.1 pyruvate kinase [Abditibacterium utsteinense]